MGNTTIIPASGQPSPIPVNGSAISAAAPGTGNWVPKAGTFSTYQLVAAAAATCIVEGTNDPDTASGAANNAVALGTITLAAAGSDGFATGSDWRWIRARLTAAAGATAVYQAG
jgi:hypothetical protein